MSKDRVIRLSIVVPRWVETASKIAGGAAFAIAISRAEAAPKYDFKPNTTIKASEINANFEDLDTRTAALEQKVESSITEWTQYTSDVSSTAGTALASKKIDPNKLTGFWRRVGDSAEIRIHLNVNCSSGYPRFSLPPGMTIDTAKVHNVYPTVGAGHVYNNTTMNGAAVDVVIQNTTTVGMEGHLPGGPDGYLSCGSFGADADVSLAFTVPVATFP
jgi:hypothetical protein